MGNLSLQLNVAQVSTIEVTPFFDIDVSCAQSYLCSKPEHIRSLLSGDFDRDDYGESVGIFFWEEGMAEKGNDAGGKG